MGTTFHCILQRRSTDETRSAVHPGNWDDFARFDFNKNYELSRAVGEAGAQDEWPEDFEEDDLETGDWLHWCTDAQYLLAVGELAKDADIGGHGSWQYKDAQLVAYVITTLLTDGFTVRLLWYTL